jgi:hypothetical protein
MMVLIYLEGIQPRPNRWFKSTDRNNFIGGGKMGKKVFYSICGFIGVLGLVFALTYMGLGFKRFFGPKHENVRREIFENTKSYTHGKTQDLAKYYEAYTTSTEQEDKDTLAELVKMNFADFDVTVIRSIKLRNFLTNIRGY